MPNMLKHLRRKEMIMTDNIKQQIKIFQSRFQKIKDGKRMLDTLKENETSNHGWQADLEIELRFRQSELVKLVDKFYTETHFDKAVERLLIEIDTFKI